MKPVMHWVGGVQTQRAQYIAGWVACCSGDKCRKLTAEAATTVVVGEVTCRACLRVMRRDVALLAKLATNAGKLGFPDLACMLVASAPVSLAEKRAQKGEADAVRLAVAVEREECARLVLDLDCNFGNDLISANEIAAAIRARSS